MSGEDQFSVRNTLLKGLETQSSSRKWDRGVEVTPPKYVAPRSVNVQEKLKEAGVTVDAQTLQKILEIARPPPKRRVPYSDNKLLADVISHHGISHTPELNNIATAKTWLENKIQHAIKSGDSKSAERWSKYAVDYQDFDDNPSTIDNVVYNKLNPGDVYSVDGYRLGSRDKSLVQRGYCGTFPTKEERRDNKLSPEYKKYLRRYPTEEARAKYPFNEKFLLWYEDKIPLYRLILERVTEVANALGFTTKAVPDDPESDVKISNLSYTSILSRIASDTYHHLLQIMVNQTGSLYKNLPAHYNFKQDPLKVLKIKDFTRNMKQIWLATSDENKSAVISMRYVADKLKEECARVDPQITSSGNATKGGMSFVDPRATAQNEAKSKPKAVWNKQKYGTVNAVIRQKYGTPSAPTGRGLLRGSRGIRTNWDLPEGMEIEPEDGAPASTSSLSSSSARQYTPGVRLRRSMPSSSSNAGGGAGGGAGGDGEQSSIWANPLAKFWK
ncbi:hypothetical protein FACS189472_06920 [Alphaproteobacteria bacterium]|nr:hypothetical protein FACS189472_06920 [Alphaproteobacteria bacterium]